MGNCFGALSQDDMSLLRGGSVSGPDSGGADTAEGGVSQHRSRVGVAGTHAAAGLTPPPPYQHPALRGSHSHRSGAEQRTRQSSGETGSAAMAVAQQQQQQADKDQIKIARRIALIQHLPTGEYDGCSKIGRECVICMGEFTFGDILRYLPCVHIYHRDCIDDWLMRSFTCPSCMEPVDAALFMTYYTTTP